MISLVDVSKSYDAGQSFAVKNISLEIKSSEILVFLGTSGCGKTTLLKLINRLIEPTSGKIYFSGEDISGQDPVFLRRKIGYVFQGIGLFPHMTAAENVGVVLRLLNWPGKKQKRRVNELMSLVHLDPESHGPRFPKELSGGQQQRVGVARSLAADPKVLLMDEPFGALDAVTRDSLQEELRRLNSQLEKTIIFVTHDVLEAFTLGDRIAVFHEGSLQQIGSPDQVLNHPETPFVRQLIHKPIDRLDALKTRRK